MQKDEEKTGFKKPIDILLEEKKIDLAVKTRDQMAEERADISMDIRMNQLGLEHRPDGKIINNRTNQLRKKTQGDKNLSVGGYLFSAAVTTAHEIMSAASGLAASFATISQTSSHNGFLNHQAQDDLYIYDVFWVCEQTAQILNKEVGEIVLLMQEIAEETNTQKIARMTMEMEDLANYYNMRPHPVTKKYVHHYDFIQTVENIHNPDKTLPCDSIIHSYRPKPDISTSRGIKRGISDVYNQRPEEIELTQSDAATQMAAKPITPTPHIS